MKFYRNKTCRGPILLLTGNCAPSADQWHQDLQFLATQLPALLERAGSTPVQAVAAASLVGPAQVLARLAEFVALRRIHPLVSARIAAALHPLGAVVFAIIGLFLLRK